MSRIIFSFVLCMVLGACAFSPVHRPNINTYGSDFTGKSFNVSSEAATSAARSALEAMGYEIQSVTPELGMIRTKDRLVIIPEICDCGTWNGRVISGTASSSIKLKIEARGPNEVSIQLEHICATTFTGRNLYYMPTRRETYQCASNNQTEGQFWKTLQQILDVRSK